MDLFEVLDDFDVEDYRVLDESMFGRDVYMGHDLDTGNPFVLKVDDSWDGENEYHQNFREVWTYLDSLDKGSPVSPPVLGFSADYSFIVTEYYEPLGERDVCLEEFPADWEDTDGTTEFGRNSDDIRVIDPGLMKPEDTWSIDNPTDSKYIAKSHSDRPDHIYVDHSKTGENIDLNFEIRDLSNATL